MLMVVSFRTLWTKNTFQIHLRHGICSHFIVDAVGSRVFFVVPFTMLTKHSKQPTLGTVTNMSHSLRIMRSLFNLQDGTKL